MKFILTLKNKIYFFYTELIYRQAVPLGAKFLLLPFSLVYLLLLRLRKFCYQHHFFSIYQAPVPVIVIGNITLGGTGKTPLAIYLALKLQEQGFQPGIVYRGYGMKLQEKALLIDQENYHPSHLYPDEAHLAWRRTHCPIAISSNKVAAVKHLLAKTQCNIILTDDGLQHTALARDVEIVVIDGLRLLGNRRLFPLGPLREPATRLKTVNAILINTEAVAFPQLSTEMSAVAGKTPLYSMRLKADKIYAVKEWSQSAPLAFFKNKKVYALSGIGHPQRFFQTLTSYGILDFIPVIFPDHYAYTASDFIPFADGEIIMTEKDAVKCIHFAQKNSWFLRVQLDTDFLLKQFLVCVPAISAQS